MSDKSIAIRQDGSAVWNRLRHFEAVAQCLQGQAGADRHSGEGIVGKETDQAVDLALVTALEPMGSAASSSQNASNAGSLCTRITSHGISISPAVEGTTR